MTQLIQLACPIDGLPLAKQAKQYRCEKGHGFDIAKQGMVLARKAFLDSDVYKASGACSRISIVMPASQSPFAEPSFP